MTYHEHASGCRSFGFDTAVAEAAKVINCARIEADDSFNGVGIVKLMGREAGQ
jgi:6-phosphofructokinase 1